MIEINLLPEEIRKKKRSVPGVDAPKVDIKALPIINIAILTAACILAIQALLFLAGVASGIYFNAMDRDYNKILPKKLEAEKISSQISRLKKKVAAIDELMVKRFSWEKKLNDLSDSVTPGIWLTSLEYDEKIIERPKASGADAAAKQGDSKALMEKVLSRCLILSGAASSMGEEGTALIGRFIKNLKDNPLFYSDFSDIELGAIQREKAADQEIMTFKITCFFKAK